MNRAAESHVPLGKRMTLRSRFLTYVTGPQCANGGNERSAQCIMLSVLIALALTSSTIFGIGCLQPDTDGDGPEFFGYTAGDNYETIFGTSYGSTSFCSEDPEFSPPERREHTYAAAYDWGYDDGYTLQDSLFSSAQVEMLCDGIDDTFGQYVCFDCNSSGLLANGYEDGFLAGQRDSSGPNYPRSYGLRRGRALDFLFEFPINLFITGWANSLDQNFVTGYYTGYSDGYTGVFDNTWQLQHLQNAGIRPPNPKPFPGADEKWNGYTYGHRDGEIDAPLGGGGNGGSNDGYYVILSAAVKQHGASADVLVNGSVVKHSDFGTAQFSSQPEGDLRYASGTTLTVRVSSGGLGQGSQIAIWKPGDGPNGRPPLWTAPSGGVAANSVTRTIP